MTEDITLQPDIPPPEVQDFILAELVRLANTFDVEHGVTLTIGGGLLSGTLISGQRYFEEQAAYAAKGAVLGTGDDESALAYQQMIVDFYRTWGATYDPEHTRPQEGRILPAPRYIHLRSAQWTSVAASPVGPLGLWRGRLSAVTGFSIGRV